jgi:hypothetical protein
LPIGEPAGPLTLATIAAPLFGKDFWQKTLPLSNETFRKLAGGELMSAQTGPFLACSQRIRTTGRGILRNRKLRWDPVSASPSASNRPSFQQAICYLSDPDDLRRSAPLEARIHCRLSPPGTRPDHCRVLPLRAGSRTTRAPRRRTKPWWKAASPSLARTRSTRRRKRSFGTLKPARSRTGPAPIRNGLSHSRETS